jgi:ribosomal-protein-alanine N-acetyltransferase
MKCLIRPWRREDAADLALALNNKNIQNNLRDGLPYPYTAADALDYINAMLGAARDTAYAFAITVDDRAVGSIGVFRRENIHARTAEMGYYVAQPYWGQGLGTAAVAQTCRYIFAKTDILRIFAEPFSYNAGSCRILEKNGFVCEGVMHSNAVKCGQILDMKLYALIRPAQQEEKHEEETALGI